MSEKRNSKTPTKTETITGYVTDVSPMKTSKKQKSYFEFKLNTQNEEKRSVCFSPEKRKLLDEIANEKERTGCEIADYKHSDNGDLLVSNFSSVKKMKLNFDKPTFQPEFTHITEILNEKRMFSMVNVKVTIYNLKETEHVVTNGKELTIRKAMAKDLTGCMAITFFCESAEQVENTKAYEITNVRIASFNGNRVLKTTESSKITDDNGSQVTLTDEDTHDNSHKIVKGTIVSVDLKTFKVRFICPQCKNEKPVDNQIIYCEDCEVMTDVSTCKNKAVVEFTFKSVDNEILKMKCPFHVLTDGFDEAFSDLKTNIQMARVMMHTEITIMYDITEMCVTEVRVEAED